VPEVKLSDYLAFCFAEVVRARENVDLYSREVAERYAADEILKDFSAPRFRVPRLTMSIPVVVTETRVGVTAEFSMPYEKFVREISRRADEIVRALERKRTPLPDGGDGRRDLSEETLQAIRAFYEELREHPTRAEQTARLRWPEIVARAIRDADGVEVSEDDGDARRLMSVSIADVIDLVRSGTVVNRTDVETLVVEPRTTRVRDEASDASVFTITAEIVEEGFYLRTLRDDQGAERRIVDFE
jgi:hypothetical protein